MGGPATALASLMEVRVWDDFTPHMLRHCFVKNLVDAGVDLPTVAARESGCVCAVVLLAGGTRPCVSGGAGGVAYANPIVGEQV